MIEPIQGDLGWHVISGRDLLDLLRRVADGEAADLVYAEAWANAIHENTASQLPEEGS